MRRCAIKPSYPQNLCFLQTNEHGNELISNSFRKLVGKTVFISGASRGIGKAIALKFAKDGANVVVAAKTATPHPKLPGTIYTAAEESKSFLCTNFRALCRFIDTVYLLNSLVEVGGWVVDYGFGVYFCFCFLLGLASSRYRASEYSAISQQPVTTSQQPVTTSHNQSTTTHNQSQPPKINHIQSQSVTTSHNHP